jgi:hypothetical protein
VHRPAADAALKVALTESWFATAEQVVPLRYAIVAARRAHDDHRVIATEWFTMRLALDVGAADRTERAHFFLAFLFNCRRIAASMTSGRATYSNASCAIDFPSQNSRAITSELGVTSHLSS